MAGRNGIILGIKYDINLNGEAAPTLLEMLASQGMVQNNWPIMTSEESYPTVQDIIDSLNKHRRKR